MRALSTIQQYVAQYNMASFLNDDLLNRLQIFRFPAYSNIYIEMDQQHYLYFLVEGQVQCYHYHLNGRLAVIAISNPFSAIGDLEILTDRPVNSNVIATRSTIMLALDSLDVNRYGADDPRFLRFIIDELRDKMYKSDSIQTSHVLPVIDRLALYILAQPPHDDDGIVLPDKDTLASLLGTTPRHLNRVLRELVEAGAISAGYPLVKILNRTTIERLTR